MLKTNKEIPANIDMNQFEQHLRDHLKVIVKELKDNNGVPPKHRQEEIKKFLGEDY